MMNMFMNIPTQTNIRRLGIRHRLALLLLVVVGALPMSAQTMRQYVTAADAAFAKQDYGTAAEYYRIALRGDTTDRQLWLRFADACRLTYRFEEADAAYTHFTNDRTRYPEAMLAHALVRKTLGRYAAARQLLNDCLSYYEGFTAAPDKGNTYRDTTSTTYLRVLSEVKCMDSIFVWLHNNRTAATLRHIDNNEINTELSDFAAIDWGNDGGLLFSSLRPYPAVSSAHPAANDEPTNDDPHNNAKGIVWQKAKNAKAAPFLLPPDPDTQYANTTLAPDGKRLYFSVCKTNPDDGVRRCNIAYTERTDAAASTKNTNTTTAKSWKPRPVVVKSLNAENATTTQPAIGYDSLAAAVVMYFASDREGGKGGTDIWRSYQKPDGTWGSPQNLGDVLNTTGDEVSPFFDTRTQTLYFSSDAHPGLGGWDIFRTRETNQAATETKPAKRATLWQKPLNLGTPINSSYNDVYFYLSPSSDSMGYLASNRPVNGSSGVCCNDIFEMRLHRQPPPQPEKPIMPLSKPALPIAQTAPPTTAQPDSPTRANSSTPLAAAPPNSVRPEANALKTMLPIWLFFDNDEPDPRTRQTTTQKSYDETYTAYYAKRQSFADAYLLRTDPQGNAWRATKANKVTTSVGSVYPDTLKSAEKAVFSFFDEEIKANYEKLVQFSHNIVYTLQSGATLQIAVRGYCSPLASTDYNQLLSTRRINCLRNYLYSFEGGVLQPYLVSGQLRITEVSRGESAAAASVSDSAANQRESVFSPAASRERRVEIIAIERSDAQKTIPNPN